MRLIIDTDTAGDDVFSLMLALRRPGRERRGHHHRPRQCRLRAARRERPGHPGGLRRGGEVPVYLGAQRPFTRAPLDAAYVFGADGMSDSGFPKAVQRPSPGHAADEIVRRVMDAPGQITLIAQAALTNIALAYLREPRIAQAVKHLWIMGGTDNGVGNVTPAAEYNLYVDPEAAKIVINAGFNDEHRHLDGDPARRPADVEQLAALDALGTPRAAFFTQVNRASLAFAQETQGLDGSLHPDALTCAVALDESLILESEMAVVDVETTGRADARLSQRLAPILPDIELADPALKRRPPNARVIKKIDQAGFYRRCATPCSNALNVYQETE
jgi:purine nucleosidase